jgi:hypothetical protein
MTETISTNPWQDDYRRYVQDLDTLPLLNNRSITGDLFGDQGGDVGLEHSGTDTHDNESNGEETDNSPRCEIIGVTMSGRWLQNKGYVAYLVSMTPGIAQMTSKM